MSSHIGVSENSGYLRVPLKGYYKSTIRVPLKGPIRVGPCNKDSTI